MEATAQGRPVALVTGGGGHIGRAIALRLAMTSAAVAIVDIDERSALKPQAWWMRRAARRDHSRRRLRPRADSGFVDAVERTFGPMAIFANNAGMEGVVAPIHEYPEDVFDHLLQVNIKGVFLGLKYVLARMILAGTGRDRQYGVDIGDPGARRTGGLCCFQACGARPDTDSGARGRGDAHSRQCDPAGTGRVAHDRELDEQAGRDPQGFCARRSTLRRA